MSLSRQYETDPNLERKGVAFQFADNDDGTAPVFYLTRANRSNPDYQKVADRIWKPHRVALRLNALPQAKQDELSLEVFAEAVCVGWKDVVLFDVTGDAKDNVKDAKGLLPKAPYNKENVMALCKRLPEFYEQLSGLSLEREGFRKLQQEGDAGNSSRSSNTSSKTEV